MKNKQEKSLTKGYYIRRLVIQLIIAVIGVIFGVEGETSFIPIVVFSCLPCGWWTTTKWFGISLNIYTLAIKIFISAFTGIICFPYQLIKNIIGIIRTPSAKTLEVVDAN